MSRIRAVFFDLDDTLCDTIGTREERARRAFAMIAAERRDLRVEEFVRQVMEPVGERLVRGVPAVVNEMGLAGSAAGRGAIGAWFFEDCVELLGAFQGVAETVDQLRGDYTLAVITNGDGKLQRVKLLRLNLGIELVVISAESGYEKPDPRIFAHALARAGVAGHEAAFVGDRLDVDIAGAKAAGMRTVWFNHWGGHLDGASPVPDAVIHGFDELPGVISSW